jgi:hypothetical protein
MINSEPATMYFPQNVNNRAFVPNYGERYRQGKTISTAFVESAVNQIVSKRFVRKTIDAVDGARDQPLAANLHPGIEREPANDCILVIARDVGITHDQSRVALGVSQSSGHGTAAEVIGVLGKGSFTTS